MSALQKMPPRLRSVPSVKGLAGQVDRLRKQNRSLRAEQKAQPGWIRRTAGIQGGAALAAAAHARMGDRGPAAVAGAATVLALLGSEDAAAAANGALALITASWVADRMAPGANGE